MDWETIYTTEKLTNEPGWGIFNETSFTGHLVLHGLDEFHAKVICGAMNEVYNQVKNDLKNELPS